MFRHLGCIAAFVYFTGLAILTGCASHNMADDVWQSDLRDIKTSDREDDPSTPPKVVPIVRTTDGLRRVSLAYPTGNPRTSAINIEKVMPQEVRFNQEFMYDIHVTNLTNHALHKVKVRDAFSSNVKVESSIPQGKIGEEGLISWSLGTLEPKGIKKIRVKAVATGKDALASCASVSYDALLCASISVVEPQLRIAKIGPEEVLVCNDIVYRYDVTNAGTGSIENVQIADILPEGITTKDGGGSIVFNAGTLAPGQTRQFTARARASKRGRFVNKAKASGSGNISASSAEVVTTVREPVLTITKIGPAKRFIGRPTTYEITVTNAGDSVARNTVIEDTLSADMKLVSMTGNGQRMGNKVRWKVGVLQPKAAEKVTLTIKSAVAGTARHTAAATAYCAQRVEASVVTKFTGIPAILLEVVDRQDPVEVGQETTYVITATNQGTAVGTNIQINCGLESNVEHVSASGITDGHVQDREVTFTPLASLAPGEKAIWEVVVKAVKAGDVRFKVSMNSDQLGRSVEETEATNLYE